jgi:hypothetical protein
LDGRNGGHHGNKIEQKWDEEVNEDGSASKGQGELDSNFHHHDFVKTRISDGHVIRADIYIESSECYFHATIPYRATERIA